MDNEELKRRLKEIQINHTEESPTETNKDRKERWNEYFKDSGHKLVKRNSNIFWKVFAILCFLLLLASLIFIGFSLYDGKFEGIIQSITNSTNICEPVMGCPKIPECPNCQINCGNTTNYINNIMS